MSVKDNFYQAVKELFNKDEEVQSPIGKSLQSSTSDEGEKKGLDLMMNEDNNSEVSSTPLIKPTDIAAGRPNIGANPAAAAAGYSSVQNSAKPAESEPVKTNNEAAKSPASSLFNKPAEAAKPAVNPFVRPTEAAASSPIKPTEEIKSAVNPFAKPAEATTPAFAKVAEVQPRPAFAKPIEPPARPVTSSLFGNNKSAEQPAKPINNSLFGNKSSDTSHLFGEDKKAEPAKTMFSASAVASAAASMPKPIDYISEVKKISTDELSASLNAIINEDYRPLSGSLESTVIAHGTIIKGDIQTTADIEINGAVVGNIESQRSVSINGQVEGNVSAESIRLSQTAINGNLTASGLVILDKDSTLIGDIKGENIIIGGKVKGNIEGKGKATLKGDSVVCGSVTVAEITIEDGAKLQGFVQTTTMDN